MSAAISLSPSATDKTITVPFDNSASLSIDWGDNKFSKTTTHTYSAAATYQIRIVGSATSYGKEGGYVGASLITSVSRWGSLGLESLRGAFFGATNLISVPTTIPSNVTDISYMFFGASKFKQDISTWYTENVAYTINMFAGTDAWNDSSAA